jgi:hypothetical protein
MTMRFQTWFVGLALVGGAAGVAAAALIWLMMTQPMTLARALAGGL